MRNLIVTASILVILAMLPYVAAQETNTVNTYGYSWPQQVIGVNVPQNPTWAHSMFLQGMAEWNAAMNWFMHTYYQLETGPYQLVESATGSVTVAFLSYSATYSYAGLTSPFVTSDGHFSRMTVQIILPPDGLPNGWETYASVSMLSIINHELGHVLGLMEAPATESNDVMCVHNPRTSQISTLDLYAVLAGAGGLVALEWHPFQGRITLPENIPYSYYNPLPVPEFPYGLVSTCVVFVVLESTKLQASRTRRRTLNQRSRANSRTK